MSAYRLTISKPAQKQLDKLPDNIADRLIKSIHELVNDPRPIGSKKLKGRDAYRIRVGDYRVIYDIIDHVLHIEVVAVGHRRDIYS